MTVYALKGIGLAPAWPSPVMSVEVDCAAIKAGTQLIEAAATGVETALAAGFVQNDSLVVFKLPAGYLCTNAGGYCHTAEGATCLIDFGDYSDMAATETDIDGWLDAFDINTAANSELTAVGDGYGTDNVTGVLSTADKYIAVKFMSAAGADVAKFTVWLIAYKVFDI